MSMYDGYNLSTLPASSSSSLAIWGRRWQKDVCKNKVHYMYTVKRDYMGYSEEVNATGKGNQSDYITVFYGWIIKLSIRAIS